MVEAGEATSDYYGQQALLVEDENALLTFFSCKGTFYDMTEPCLIIREKVNPLHFQKLFAYKLRQYNGALLHLPAFLHYHLVHNFQQEQAAYNAFLRVTLVQIDLLFNQSLTDEVAYWMQLQSTDDAIMDVAIPPNYCASVAGQIETSATHLPPLDSLTVAGKWTIEEMQHYFSFLHKTMLDHGRTFLNQAAVAEVFKFGIAIPPAPPKEKYLFKVSRQYPGKVIY